MASFLGHDLISFRFNELSAVSGTVVSKSENLAEHFSRKKV